MTEWIIGALLISLGANVGQAIRLRQWKRAAAREREEVNRRAVTFGRLPTDVVDSLNPTNWPKKGGMR